MQAWLDEPMRWGDNHYDRHEWDGNEYDGHDFSWVRTGPVGGRRLRQLWHGWLLPPVLIGFGDPLSCLSRQKPSGRTNAMRAQCSRPPCDELGACYERFGLPGRDFLQEG